MTFIEWITTPKGDLTLAGLAGSAVSVVMEWSGFKAGLRRLFVGAVTAYYMGPVGVPLFQWALGHISIEEGQSSSIGGFIMGVAGVIIVEIMLKAFRLRSAELVQGRGQDEN